MSDAPNIEHIRKRFIERVGNAFFQSWAALGLTGEKYSFGQAAVLAATMFDSSEMNPDAPCGDDVTGD